VDLDFSGRDYKVEFNGPMRIAIRLRFGFDSTTTKNEHVLFFIFWRASSSVAHTCTCLKSSQPSSVLIYRPRMD